MLKQKFSGFTERYGKFLRGFVDLHDNTPLHINQLRFKLGDKITFMTDEKIYEGEITDFEKPLYNESMGEIDGIEVDGEEFSIGEIDWIGIE